MAGTDNHLMWNMTRICNYRCRYCYFPPQPGPVTAGVSSEELVRFLDSTGAAWTIGMTGGEPLLYPDFAGLCRRLTENHRIELDSNLSLSGTVRRLADEVDPSRVVDIYAALHIEERERRDGRENFIRNVLYLKDRGFHVSVNYVVHPLLIDRYAADFEYFLSRGVKLIPRPFKGFYQGRHFPAAYGPEAKEIFSAKPSAGRKMVFNFKGVACDAGRRLLRMEADGTIFRCSGDRTRLGDVHFRRRPARRSPTVPGFPLPLFRSGIRAPDRGPGDVSFRTPAIFFG